MKHHFFPQSFSRSAIDEKNGIIRGAVACQAGLEARGHDLKTDRVLLNQLLLSAKAKGDKLPVHLDHRSGAAGCIGTAQAFRLDGDKLRCDLHFFRSARQIPQHHGAAFQSPRDGRPFGFVRRRCGERESPVPRLSGL